MYADLREFLNELRARGQLEGSRPRVRIDHLRCNSKRRSFLNPVSLKTGKQLWKYNVVGGIIAGPAVGEGCLVVGTEGSGGLLYCFGGK